MKLKTTQNSTHDLIDATDENLIHDALAAHALLRVLDEWEHAYPDEVNDMHKRADELMREWTTSEPSSNPR